MIRPVGALDLATSDDVEQQLRSCLDEGHAVVLDLSEVDFLDSSGMRGILRAHRLAEERGVSFAIAPGPPAVQRVLHITGLAPRLRFVPGDSPDPGATRA